MIDSTEPKRSLTIAGVTIDDAADCYVIAEIGHNHQGVSRRQGAVRRGQASCGATRSSCRSATTARSTRAPLTTSRTTTRTASARPTASTARRSSSAATSTRSCRRTPGELGVTFFATAFDIASADFLAELDMPAYKIASGDLKNTPLLKHVAAVRQADDHLHRRRATRGRAARLRHDHADQPAARDPAVHGRLPGGVRGARPARHRDATASEFPDAVIGFSEPRQRHRDAGRGVHARRADRREALHAEPRDEGHRPRVLARAGGPAQAGARPATRTHRRSATASRRSTTSEVAPLRQDGQEAGRGARPARPATCSRPRRHRR